MNKTVALLKRGMDITGSVVGLALGAPLMGAIAAAIKLDDGGPIFYRQVRAGSNDDASADPAEVWTFRMYKFRTMRTDAEKLGAQFAQERDPRVTRIGGFLRRTRLDEIPNLINVLKGEMSIIGPRPERPEHLTNLSAAIPFFEERMRNVRPGITGLAQVNLDYLGHLGDDHQMAHIRDFLVNPFDLDYSDDGEPVTADDMRTKILFDFAYAATLEKVSSWLRTDLEIVIKTPMVMFRGKGR